MELEFNKFFDGFYSEKHNLRIPSSEKYNQLISDIQSPDKSIRSNNALTRFSVTIADSIPTYTVYIFINENF